MDGHITESALHQSISNVTTYWQVQYADSFCQTPRTAIPWLLSIVALTICWTILLGASDVRRYIRKPFAGPLSSISNKAKWRFSIWGSLILQFIFLLATAQLLRKGSTTSNGQRTQLTSTMGAWFVRPMPGLVVSMTSVMSVSTYQINAMEIMYVETALGLGAGYFYINIMQKSQKSISVFESLYLDNLPANLSATAAATATTVTSTSTFSEATSAPTSGGFLVTPDGTCGANLGYTCSGAGFGDCCSAFGTCGNDVDHCERRGCQPEYGTCGSASKTIRRRRGADGLRERNVFGTRQEPGVPDGQCGPGASCLGTEWGNCCSSTSYCGSNATYCGTGCQPEFGDCWNAGTTDSPISPQTSSELELVKNLKTMRDTSILMIVVFCLSFVVLGPMHFVKKAVGVMICFHVLSLSRFIGAILLWTYALRLAPDELCLSEKTMTGVTVMWVVVPLADHCWRAVFSY